MLATVFVPVHEQPGCGKVVICPCMFSKAVPLHGSGWISFFAFGPPISCACATIRMCHVQETQKEILEYAHDACHVFPGFEDQCEIYVNMYGPLVMGVIQQYLQPDAMCSRLGFCPLPPALH